jgi:hypothetical protein
MGKSDQSVSIWALLCLFLGLGGMILVVRWLDDLYYEPLCKRYGGSQQLAYSGYKAYYKRTPGKCYYYAQDSDGAYTKHRSVLVKEIPKTTRDWVVGTLRWAGIIGAGAVMVGFVGWASGLGTSRHRSKKERRRKRKKYDD